MSKFSLGLFSALALAITPALGACDFEIGDLNNPSLEDLENNPTAASLGVACTGLIAGHRVATATANGYVVQLGILGREAYNFDTADPRYINELLVGTLAKGSPFGGAFWVAPYANIRLANIVVRGVDNVAEYSAEQRSAIKGFARTFIALDLLRVIITRDTIGAVVDTDKPLGDPLGAVESKAAVYAAIAKYLDDAKVDLLAGGTAAFPFPVTAGFAGFDTPPNFLKFNRAIRARVAVYVGDGATALTALGESFINPAATTQAALDAGPFFVYSANAGDTQNLMTNRNIWAHPSIKADAQLNGATIDARYTRKINEVAAGMGGSGGGLTSNLKFKAYTAPTSPVPIIRNEELILLRAEAEQLTGMLPQAVADLNIVRTVSGGLLPLDPLVTDTSAEVLAEIIYNRRYSLLMEGGHRWIDVRRLGVDTDSLLDLGTHRFNVRYPIPQGECDARPGEQACTITSAD
jgi:starch-binding outer membrane protein, SusD/RagB family